VGGGQEASWLDAEPTQLTPFHRKEKLLYSKFPPEVQAPPPHEGRAILSEETHKCIKSVSYGVTFSFVGFKGNAQYLGQ